MVSTLLIGKNGRLHWDFFYVFFWKLTGSRTMTSELLPHIYGCLAALCMYIFPISNKQKHWRFAERPHIHITILQMTAKKWALFRVQQEKPLFFFSVVTLRQDGWCKQRFSFRERWEVSNDMSRARDSVKGVQSMLLHFLLVPDRGR